MANLGSGIVRRPAADLVSSTRRRPSPGTRMTLPVIVSMPPFSSKSCQRSLQKVQERREAGVSDEQSDGVRRVVLCAEFGCLPEACGEGRANWWQVKATAPFGIILDTQRLHVAYRVGTEHARQHRKLQRSAKRRIDLDWRAIVAP